MSQARSNSAGMPRSRANAFPVPSGSTPSVEEESTKYRAIEEKVPSPPPATIRGISRSIAVRTSARSSSMVRKAHAPSNCSPRRVRIS
jgi:hypothetical protein